MALSPSQSPSPAELRGGEDERRFDIVHGLSVMDDEPEEIPGGSGSGEYQVAAAANAADCSARITHWLERRAGETARLKEADWHKVLRQMADALREIEALEIVQQDARVAALFRRLARSVDLEDFNEQLDIFLFHLANAFNKSSGGDPAKRVRCDTGLQTRRPIDTQAESAQDDTVSRMRMRL